MELIERKILLENYVDRGLNSSNYGTITATTFHVNIYLTQTIDDMGLFTDMSFIETSSGAFEEPDYSTLTNKLMTSGITFPFMNGLSQINISGLTEIEELTLRLTGTSESDYYNFGNLKISGLTDSKIENLKTYNANYPYIAGFDINKTVYSSYTLSTISGVSRVTSLNDPKVYVFDASNDLNIGTANQTSGLQYFDYSGKSRNLVIDDKKIKIPLTQINYIGEGSNMTNTSLSAITKEEYLFGIISIPEIQSDVYIDRGTNSVMDKHLRLSEIKSLDQITRYGNGFYNINKF